MSKTVEMEAQATGFDPREFAKEHGLESASVEWSGINKRYQVWAHNPELGPHKCCSAYGSSVSEAFTNLLKEVRSHRNRPAREIEAERIARIERLRKELSALESTSQAEAQS